MDVLNEGNLGNPIVACPGIGFHPPGEGEGSAVLVVFEDTQRQLMFKKTCFLFLLLSRCSSFAFLVCFMSPTKDCKPTAMGVKRMEAGDRRGNLVQAHSAN